MKPVFMKNFVLMCGSQSLIVYSNWSHTLPSQSFIKYFRRFLSVHPCRVSSKTAKMTLLTNVFLLNTKKQHGWILTLVKQHFHYVRVTLPGGSVQWGISEFILKHKTWLLLANTLTRIYFHPNHTRFMKSWHHHTELFVDQFFVHNSFFSVFPSMINWVLNNISFLTHVKLLTLLPNLLNSDFWMWL